MQRIMIVRGTREDVCQTFVMTHETFAVQSMKITLQFSWWWWAAVNVKQQIWQSAHEMLPSVTITAINDDNSRPETKCHTWYNQSHHRYFFISFFLSRLISSGLLSSVFLLSHYFVFVGVSRRWTKLDYYPSTSFLSSSREWKFILFYFCV